MDSLSTIGDSGDEGRRTAAETGEGFSTPLFLLGPTRHPTQMLQEQRHGDHASIHDEEMAAGVNLSGAPIEGPTHFSQLDPLATGLWGRRWFERGCVSAHFVTMCVEGDEVRAGMLVPYHGSTTAEVTAEKHDGATVLTGTAGIDLGQDTEVRRRLARARPLEAPVILDGLAVGQRGRALERVQMGLDTHMGDMYPFTLREKLAKITERHRWYDESSPWGPPIIPFEMVSVLTMSTAVQAGFAKREPSVGLFIDLEVRMLQGPLLVDREYTLERQIVGLSESRRTESYWTLTTVRDEGREVAEILLHQGVFKESYPDYPPERLP